MYRHRVHVENNVEVMAIDEDLGIIERLDYSYYYKGIKISKEEGIIYRFHREALKSLYDKYYKAYS